MATVNTLAPLRLVLWSHYGHSLADPYYERLECGHDWKPTWRNRTGSHRLGLAFSMRRRCVTCQQAPSEAE
jgi:hypothetical protein